MLTKPNKKYFSNWTKKEFFVVAVCSVMMGRELLFLMCGKCSLYPTFYHDTVLQSNLTEFLCIIKLIYKCYQVKKTTIEPQDQEYFFRSFGCNKVSLINLLLCYLYKRNFHWIFLGKKKAPQFLKILKLWLNYTYLFQNRKVSWLNSDIFCSR